MSKNLLVTIFSFLSITVFSQDKFRLSSNAGYGYITGSLQTDLPSDVEKHNRKLKFGYVYEMDLGYDVNDVWGFGIYFGAFHSNNKTSVDGTFLNTFDSDGSIIGSDLSGVDVEISDNIEINLYAPKLYFMMLEDSNKHQLITGAAVGYLRYKNNRIRHENKQEITANTFGLALSAEYEYQLASFISLFSRLGATVSFVSEFEVDDSSGKRTVSVDKFTNGARSRENLSTLSLTLGIRANIPKPKRKKKKQHSKKS